MKRWVLAALIACGLALAIVLPTSAACEVCFEIELEDGTVRQICIPLCYIEVQLFDVPPYAERDLLYIPEILGALEEATLEGGQPWGETMFAEPDPEPWLLISPTGEHVLALDVENEVLVEIPAEVGGR